MKSNDLLSLVLLLSCLFACQPSEPITEETSNELDFSAWTSDPKNEAQQLLHKYTPFTLTTDLSKLSDNQKKMIPILIQASQIMDDLFWYDAYGDKEELLSSIEDEDLRSFALINYGPWDRLNGNSSFCLLYTSPSPRD